MITNQIVGLAVLLVILFGLLSGNPAAPSKATGKHHNN